MKEITEPELRDDLAAVLREAEHRDVLLRRRDGSDVMLVDADREQGIRESLALTVDVLAAIFDEVDLAALSDQIFASVPWTTFLPDDAKKEFLRELVATTRGCDELDSYQALAQLISEWKATAAIHADPQLLGALTSPTKGSGRPVPRP